MKWYFKLLCLVLCVILLIPTISFAVVTDEGTQQSTMVDVCIASTDDYFIVVSVPKCEAESYQKRLQNDALFLQNEVQFALKHTQLSTRSLPPGQIDFQSYMYESDIQKAIDSYAGWGAFDRWRKAVGLDFNISDVKRLIELTKQDVFILSAKALCTAVCYAQKERQAWWEEAYHDILKKKITAVRYSIIRNEGEYPKIWRVFDRV